MVEGGTIDPEAIVTAQAGGTIAGLGVHSEIGRLRRVVLRRPGFELNRFALPDRTRLPSKDVHRVRQARQEHDAFADALAGHGVEVLYLGDLLVETLELPQARAELIEETLGATALAPGPAAALAVWLDSLGSLELAAHLIGGVAGGQVPALKGSRRGIRRIDGSGFVVPPLPGHGLLRTAATWIFDGVALRAERPGERGESIYLAAICRHHPGFAGSPHEVWTEGLAGPARLDGNDVFVLGDGCLLITTGAETTGITAALLAKRLFAAGSARRVIVASPPAGRTGVTLATGLTMVDRETFAVRRGLCEDAVVHSLHPHDGDLFADRETDLFAAIADALDVDSLRLIEIDADHRNGDRHRVSGGTGVLAVAPGAVLASDHHTEANAMLRRAGIDVTTVPAAGRTAAGASLRSMSCAIARDRA